MNYETIRKSYTEAKEFAYQIEQFMFERGEYDYAESDRIRWLENVDEPYTLAKGTLILDDNREYVITNIAQKLHDPETSKEEAEALLHYFESEAATIDNEDDLLDEAVTLKDELAEIVATYEKPELPKDYSKVFEDMLDVMEFSLDKHDDGYAVIDLQKADLGNIEADRYETAAQLAERLDIYINDYYFTDLEEAAETDFDVDFSQKDAPSDCEEWIKFLDERPEFKTAYQHEYDVMDMIANHIEDVQLEKIWQNQNPDKLGDFFKVDGLDVKLNDVDCVNIQDNGITYIGGTDENGHEKKDNYAENARRLTITLEDNGIAVFELDENHLIDSFTFSENRFSEDGMKNINGKIRNFIESCDDYIVYAQKDNERITLEYAQNTAVSAVELREPMIRAEENSVEFEAIFWDNLENMISRTDLIDNSEFSSFQEIIENDNASFNSVIEITKDNDVTASVWISGDKNDAFETIPLSESEKHALVEKAEKVLGANKGLSRLSVKDFIKIETATEQSKDSVSKDDITNSMPKQRKNSETHEME